MGKLSTGDSQGSDAILQGTKRISHTFDDLAANVLTQPAYFRLVDDTTTGDIMVVLWGEELSEKAVMSVQQAHRDNILIKKIYDTGTVDVTEADITLYR